MNFDEPKAWYAAHAPRWLSYPVVMVLGAAVLAGAWLLWQPAPDPAGTVTIATPAKEVKRAEKIKVPVKTVTVYKTTPAIKKSLSLPKPVVDDAQESVLASSKIPAGERAHTVTTVLNTETGASETYVRTDPLPWFQIENRGEIGLYHGLKGGERTTRLVARQDVLQVKALHIGAIATVDKGSGKPETYFGIGVSYRW